MSQKNAKRLYPGPLEDRSRAYPQGGGPPRQTPGRQQLGKQPSRTRIKGEPQVKIVKGGSKGRGAPKRRY
jgi:hypothetical protein